MNDLYLVGRFQTMSLFDCERCFLGRKIQQFLAQRMERGSSDQSLLEQGEYRRHDLHWSGSWWIQRLSGEHWVSGGGGDRLWMGCQTITEHHTFTPMKQYSVTIQAPGMFLEGK